MFNLKVFVLAALLGAVAASADDTASCSGDGTVLLADDGLSPCQIAALMVGGGYMPAESPFPSLTSENRTSYEIPVGSDADDLHCNMVFYNLVSGCAACQSDDYTWSDWLDWTAHCKSQSSLGYIASIMPYNTPIPNWAFTDAIATGGTFNATAAKLVATNLFDVPDTVFNVPSNTTDSSSAASCPDTASISSSSVNTGAIAGGTVGGFVSGALLGALGVFLAGRKKGAKKTNDGQHSIHSQDTQDTIAQEKTRMASIA